MKPAATNRSLDYLTYLDDYVDTIEALPLELQRNFTLMRELDGYAQEMMEEVAKDAIYFIDNVKSMSPKERIEVLRRLSDRLNESLKRGEEKVALSKSTYDTVDRHCQRLDNDIQKFEDEQLMGFSRLSAAANRMQQESKDKKEGKDRRGEKRGADTTPSKKRKLKENTITPPPTTGRSAAIKTSKDKSSKPLASTSSKSGRKDNYSVNNSKEKSRKAALATDMPIDPNEPTYCYCEQVSYGEMIACDNENCEIEWFHYPCVGLKAPPKGSWYCNECTALMKQKKK
ncbi:uncharacterized protein VTP21DRAFT_306 [Calcarisporiella thermophila]|uniref:uncharacterized protein n=1 Tax=Calcarisporiella thermophila TaxID=911321 RepID=UPI0037441C75